ADPGQRPHGHRGHGRPAPGRLAGGRRPGPPARLSRRPALPAPWRPQVPLRPARSARGPERNLTGRWPRSDQLGPLVPTSTSAGAPAEVARFITGEVTTPARNRNAAIA